MLAFASSRGLPPYVADPTTFDPLVLPLVVALGLGFALRRADRHGWLLFAAAVVALALPWAPARLVGMAALLGVGLTRARRRAAAPVLLGGGAVTAAVLLAPDGWAPVLTQLRLLALAGGGGGLAVLGLALLGGTAPARRAAGLAAVVGLYALIHDGATAWPDGWRLTSPYLIWSAPALTLVALIGARTALVALAPAAAALLGAVSGTGPGVDGALWALAGAGLAVGLADEHGRLDRWTAGVLGGLPIGLPFAAAALALWAAASAVHPAPLRIAAASTAAGMLLAALRAGWITPARGARRDRVLAGVLLALGGLYLGGLRPTAPFAERTAAAIDGHRLPIDDMRGWRRLSRLEAAPPAADPPDAGAP